MMIISHRGNDNHNYKENTIEAVVFSLNRDYVDGVEVDIMFTKDKEIVLNHDYIFHMLFIFCKLSCILMTEYFIIYQERNTSQHLNMMR